MPTGGAKGGGEDDQPRDATQRRRAANPELPRMRPDRLGRAQSSDVRRKAEVADVMCAAEATQVGPGSQPKSLARVRPPPAQAGRDPETPGVVAGVLRRDRRSPRSAK